MAPTDTSVGQVLQEQAAPAEGLMVRFQKPLCTPRRRRLRATIRTSIVPKYGLATTSLGTHLQPIHPPITRVFNNNRELRSPTLQGQTGRKGRCTTQKRLRRRLGSRRRRSTVHLRTFGSVTLAPYFSLRQVAQPACGHSTLQTLAR